MEPLELEITTSTSLALTLLLSLALTGFYFYENHVKYTSLEKKIKEIEFTTHETETLQEAHADALQECAECIREKKDFDESEEVEDGKYQAWSGTFSDSTIHLTIHICREKESTVKKNQNWINWDKTADGSCIVRDFYLGNGNPDFSWILSDSQARVHDTLINGWDSVCKIEIQLVGEKDTLLSFVQTSTFEGSQTCNLLLKKCIEKDLIEWSRILTSPN